MRAYILPHPPIAVPEVGGAKIKEIEATEQSFAKVGQDIKEYDPETIIIISPHNVMYRDAFFITKGEGGYGNLGVCSRTICGNPASLILTLFFSITKIETGLAPSRA